MRFLLLDGERTRGIIFLEWQKTDRVGSSVKMKTRIEIVRQQLLSSLALRVVDVPTQYKYVNTEYPHENKQ